MGVNRPRQSDGFNGSELLGGNAGCCMMVEGLAVGARRMFPIVFDWLLDNLRWRFDHDAVRERGFCVHFKLFCSFSKSLGQAQILLKNLKYLSRYKNPKYLLALANRNVDKSLDSNTTANDSSNDSEEEEKLAKILEPLSKEQLIELITKSAWQDPKLISEIHQIADRDPANRKIFVHRLDLETTSEKLRSFFSKYGDLEGCNVVTDKFTKKSKGYGFLLFKHHQSAKKALKNRDKKIDRRIIACHMASAGPIWNPENQPRKIFVGNVPSHIPSNKLVSFFSRYGDKETGKSKGFAIFIYRRVEGARKALEEPDKKFEGHLLCCKKSTKGHNHLPEASGPGNGPGGGGINMEDMGLLGQGLFGEAPPFDPPNRAAVVEFAITLFLISLLFIVTFLGFPLFGRGKCMWCLV
ncbi:UBP1-associated protein 2A-like [Tasmannia lanceolata]|uniref:UBP1-associated protein 2A-like n=1 Tax=Tasmannia lanceolata TaxID=3420 RepID=UPI0040643590